MRSFLLSCVLLAACGGEIASVDTGSVAPDPAPAPAPSPSPSASSTAGATVDTGPPNIVGEVIALTANTNGSLSERFDINFQDMTLTSAWCAGASATAGSCCYFGPIKRPPTQPPGDGGSVATERSAGTVNLTSSGSSSNAAIDTFEYSSGIYKDAPGVYQSWVWQPGDVLHVTASGGDIGAFAVSAPALVPPAANVASTFARNEDLTITWRPDANAETFAVSILDGGTGAVVACSVPDASGTVTIAASLLSELNSDTRLQGSAMRRAFRYAQTPSGRVAFATVGWATFGTATSP